MAIAYSQKKLDDPHLKMKFSIVTPTYNSERFLRETIESILSQRGDFQIEYILADGGSTDRTLDIFEEYKNANADPRITLISFSEKDRGMYDALNKGFARATGDVYAWLNSDDLYLPGALSRVARAFTQFPDIEWILGSNILINESGSTIRKGSSLIYARAWIQKGMYGRYAPFITQESVFWRKSLWKRAGPLEAQLRYAGDYKLWIDFAAHAPLISLNSPVSAFRRHNAQLSTQGNAYRAEQARVRAPQHTFEELRIKSFFWLVSRFPFLRPLWRAFYLLVFGSPGEYIAYDRGALIRKKAKTYTL